MLLLLLTLIPLSASLLKIVVVLCGGLFRGKVPNLHEGIHIRERPLYTVIIPIFMEKSRDVANLRKHMLSMKYENFEILYLCEDIDVSTIFYLKSLSLRCYERVILVPRIRPFTKPKACNYGLEFAKGRYIVVYDVEDRPHPLQLSVAEMVFSNSNYSCIQFPLEFISDGTMLSYWQRIDYLVWYKRLLPILYRFKLPIPLGGTSNHFRVSTLRGIGGWDAFNVTEDAELGLRMFKMNLDVCYIDRYATQETTLGNFINLIHQRVRWSKGHVITAFSFMLSSIGIKNCIAVFYVLLLNQVCYIFYISLTLYYGFYQDAYLLTILTVSTLTFLLYPVFLLISFPELRKGGGFVSTVLLPFFYTFYAIPIMISFVECIFMPSAWYKTKR